MQSSSDHNLALAVLIIKMANHQVTARYSPTVLEIISMRKGSSVYEGCRFIVTRTGVYML